jgi:hypothetical protein
MMTPFSFVDATTIDSMMRLVMQNPQVSSVIGGIGLGNLFYHLPRFRKEKAQTIGIGALTAGYLLDSAAHIILAGSSIGALGIATVGLLAGGTAFATYAGLEWAGNQKSSKSKLTTVAVAGFGALHFGSHGYIAARALLGTVRESVSLFGAGLLGLAGNLGLVAVAAYTLYKEMTTHGNGQRKSDSSTAISDKDRGPRFRKAGSGNRKRVGPQRHKEELRGDCLKAA